MVIVKALSVIVNFAIALKVINLVKNVIIKVYIRTGNCNGRSLFMAFEKVLSRIFDNLEEEFKGYKGMSVVRKLIFAIKLIAASFAAFITAPMKYLSGIKSR